MVKKSSAAESTSSHGGAAEADTSPKYKGVRKRKWGKWVSEIRLPNCRERIWLGSYDSPEKAARAFDAAQFCLRGRSANFNFPNNPPDIAGGRSMTPAEIQAAASRFANMPVQDSSSSRLKTEEEEEEEEDTTSYSPSISDGATTSTVQMESGVAGLEGSFHNQLNLTGSLGSGNYASDFGLFSELEDFSSGDFYSPQPHNFDYGGNNGEDNYDTSLYHGSFLWDF